MLVTGGSRAGRGRGGPNRTGKKQSVTQPLASVLQEMCNVMPLGGCGAAQPGLSGQQKGREASPLQAPVSCPGKAPIVSPGKPGSSASLPPGTQSDPLQVPLPSQGLSFRWAQVQEPLAGGSVDSYPSWALYCPPSGQTDACFPQFPGENLQNRPPQSWIPDPE